MKKEIKEIASKEMAFLNKKDRQFQEYLNEKLSKESDTYIRSHATIINMRVHGKTPNTDVLEDILSVYPGSDRRFQFALQLLALKSPHVWGPDGVVWSLKDKVPTTAK